MILVVLSTCVMNRKSSHHILDLYLHHKRETEFDVLKFIAILGVIWTHCIQYFLSSNYWENPIYRYSFPFINPLFMILSGLFFDKCFKVGFRKMTIKKVRQLILPTILWCLAFDITTGGFRDAFYLGRFLNIFYWQLWFLKSAFICSVIGYAVSIQQSKKHFWIAVAITVSVSQFLGLPRSIMLPYMYPCFVMGVIVNRYMTQLQAKSKTVTISVS